MKLTPRISLKFIGTLAVLALMSGCLKTREDIAFSEQRQVIQQQQPNGGSSVKSAPVDPVLKISEIEDDMRNLSGRIEVLENNQKLFLQSGQVDKKNSEQTLKDLSAKFNLLQEEMIKMETQMTQLQSDLNGVKNSVSVNSGKGEKSSGDKKSTIDQADQHFKSKDWKKAILAYQKYRDDNPKGKFFADATFKIGQSFQELNMKDEAKTFYDEVIAKFPQTELAKKAKTRLNQLKK